MIVRLDLEPVAIEFRPGRWHAVLVCPSRRFKGRPVWIGATVYLSEVVALRGADRMLRWLERRTWMGET